MNFSSNITGRKSRYSYMLLAPILVCLFFFWAKENLRLFKQIENQTIDWRFQHRPETEEDIHKDIIVVQIDEESLRHFGRWPWPRNLHGDMVQLLSHMNPKVIAMDFLFSEYSHNHAEDDQFAASVAEQPAFISGAMLEHFDENKYRKNVSDKRKRELVEIDEFWYSQPITHITGDVSLIPGSSNAVLPFASREDPKTKEYVNGLLENSYFGFIDSPPNKIDGMKRELPSIVKIRDTAFPSFYLRILMHYWDLVDDDVEVLLGEKIILNLGDRKLEMPINEKGRYEINYHKTESFTAIGYSDLFNALARHLVKGEEWPKNYPNLEGKILIFGQTADALTDLGPSPVEPISPLVMTHANAVNNFLLEDPLVNVPIVQVLGIWFLLTYVTLFPLRKANVSIALLVPIVLNLIFAYVSITLFYEKDYKIETVWPSMAFMTVHMGFIGLRWLRDHNSRKEVRDVFASYITPQVMESLLENPDNVKLGGQSKPVTVFFSDIRSFTSISENMGEQELVEHLNEYFNRMVYVINQYNGTLHKYIGDAVMAVWGDVASAGDKEDACNAVRACIDMSRELEELNEKWRSEGKIEFAIGMGLNHGTVLVGNIGADQRKEFTVIGDGVNMASRLEGLTSHFKVELIVGQSVKDLAGDLFWMRTVGVIVLKGKTIPVRTYEVFCEKGKEPEGFSIEWVELYEKSFEQYLNREFTEAIKGFKKCLEIQPEEKLTQKYLEECKEWEASPPDSEWNGVISMTSK